MYYFLQFKPNKKEAWRMYSEEQVANSSLPGPPAFQTVLKVDQDPEQVLENELDPVDTVKYEGPMYLDFDDAENIDAVLDDVREVLDHLMNKLDIPEQFIHCWLSGGKGVHIVIPGQIFGLKGPTKFLPMIYREIAATFKVRTLDMNVYSCGRGRMWRCEGVARPGTGTYKVATTPNELSHMDSEEYHQLVASPRPKLDQAEPAASLTFPKAQHLFKAARVAATRKVRAMKEATVVPKEALREWEGIPGCVEKLITEGDCESSNWNQAAMQLATYISVRYERTEEAEYMEQLVKPFAHNVNSSSRPSETERIKHTKEQLNRAFRGSIKFAPGAFIATIGRPCGGCPVCRSDVAEGTVDQDEATSNYNDSTKMRWDSTGYWLVGENGSRQLTTFTFWPEVEVYELVPTTLPNGLPGWKHSNRQELRGILIDDEGVRTEDVKIPERAWGSKRELITSVKGCADALVYAGDADIQRMLKTIMTFARGKAKADNREIEKMVRTNVCGIIFDRNGKNTIPHYVEAEASITLAGRSPYRYHGNPRQSPALLGTPNPLENDAELEMAITSLCRVNDPVQVALTIGWFAACHFREHIQYEEPQFPLLNISGNSEAGKTSLAVLAAMICGIDYTRAEFLNVEVGTLYPLTKYISSSTTVPRLIEEVNPLQLGTAYFKVVGMLKASWNKAPIQRGKLNDRELTISEDRVSSPLVYTSEQTATVPSLRSRSVEVKLSSRSLQNPKYTDNYQLATANRQALLRIAKAMVTVAMNTSPTELLKIFHSKDSLINSGITARPRWGFKTCLTGLHMLMHTMQEFKVGGHSEVQDLYNQLVEYLGGRVVEAERGKSSSEVDKVVNTFNMMADEPDGSPSQLLAGKHYWRAGDSLYLVLQSCLPMYLRFVRNLGEPAVIRDYHQMRSLLEGETYFERREPHPTRENAEVFVISIRKMADKGTSLNNFTESDPEDC